MVRRHNPVCALYAFICYHATDVLHSCTLKPTIQLLKQNSSTQSTVTSSQSPKKGFQATTVSFPTSHPFQATAHVGASGSPLQLHYISIPTMLPFVPCRRPSDRRQCRCADSMAFLTIISQSCLQRCSGSLLAPQEPNSGDANNY